MESLQFVGCSWFIGLIGLVSDLPKINFTETETCLRSRTSPVSSRLHLDAPGVHSLAKVTEPSSCHDPISTPRLRVARTGGVRVRRKLSAHAG